MKDPYKFPKLRWPLDIGSDTIENEQIVYLRCPMGISPTPLVLKAAIAPVLSRFDGTRSDEQILAEFSQAGLSKEILKELVDLLELHCFLDSPRYYAEEKRVREEFQNSSTRSPMIAGVGYGGSKESLEKELEAYLAKAADSKTEARAMCGIVAPHIDYRRGNECYGKTYNALRDQKHDIYLLIGTAHQYSPRLFHLTNKDFETPLATLQADRALIDELAKLYGPDRSFEDGFLHKREHSLELQTPFLAHLQPKAKIVPVLVGSFYNFISSNKYPEEHEVYESFLEPLAKLCSKSISDGKNFCVVSGVDMAHVGQTFGDKGSLSPKFMEEIAERDEAYLQAIESQDKHALFDHIAEDGDARRICGYPSMYLMLDLLERLSVSYSVERLDYRQAVDYRTDCAVTFAGLAFYTRSHTTI